MSHFCCRHRGLLVYYLRGGLFLLPSSQPSLLLLSPNFPFYCCHCGALSSSSLLAVRTPTSCGPVTTVVVDSVVFPLLLPIAFFSTSHPSEVLHVTVFLFCYALLQPCSLLMSWVSAARDFLPLCARPSSPPVAVTSFLRPLWRPLSLLVWVTPFPFASYVTSFNLADERVLQLMRPSWRSLSLLMQVTPFPFAS